MKSQTASDFTFPKKGFFSNHSYNHSLANPKSYEDKPQPKRYDPRQNYHENIAWVKPDHNQYESSYHAAFNKDTPSNKIMSRVQAPEVYPTKNLSNTLIPTTWPTESKRRPVAHHETGLQSRDYREVSAASHKQYPKTKFAEHMIETTLAFSPQTQKFLTPASSHSRSPIHPRKNASNVLRAIYVDRSDLAEHIRENHDDVHMQGKNKANRERFKAEVGQYNRIFGGRAGVSSINERLHTMDPQKRPERRDVSSDVLRPLMDHSFVHEKDYKQVDKDFKYAYVAPCHSRHPVLGKSYGKNGGEKGRETFNRIMGESQTRSLTPNGRSSSTYAATHEAYATPMNISRVIRKHKNT